MEMFFLFFEKLFTTCKDVTPIFLLIFVYQFVLLRQPVPHLSKVLVGLVYIILGLTLFQFGLEKALFPLGKTMAVQLSSPSFLGGPGTVASSLPGITMAGSIFLPPALVLQQPLPSRHYWLLLSRPRRSQAAPFNNGHFDTLLLRELPLVSHWVLIALSAAHRFHYIFWLVTVSSYCRLFLLQNKLLRLLTTLEE